MEANVKNESFDQVLKTLLELENTESSVIETLFYYKISDMEEFNKEADEVTKAYKQGQLDPAGDETQATL